LGTAKKLAAAFDADITFAKGELLRVEGGFSVVTAFDFLYRSSLLPTLNRVAQALRPGGVFAFSLIEQQTPSVKGRNYYSQEDVEELLGRSALSLDLVVTQDRRFAGSKVAMYVARRT